MTAAKGRATNRAQDDRPSTSPRLTGMGDCRDTANLAIGRACGRSEYLSSVVDEVSAQAATGPVSVTRHGLGAPSRLPFCRGNRCVCEVSYLWSSVTTRCVRSLTVLRLDVKVVT